jgi:hypothetical protein
MNGIPAATSQQESRKMLKYEYGSPGSLNGVRTIRTVDERKKTRAVELMRKRDDADPSGYSFAEIDNRDGF